MNSFQNGLKDTWLQLLVLCWCLPQFPVSLRRGVPFARAVLAAPPVSTIRYLSALIRLQWVLPGWCSITWLILPAHVSHISPVLAPSWRHVGHALPVPSHTSVQGREHSSSSPGVKPICPPAHLLKIMDILICSSEECQEEHTGRSWPILTIAHASSCRSLEGGTAFLVQTSFQYFHLYQVDTWDPYRFPCDSYWCRVYSPAVSSSRHYLFLFCYDRVGLHFFGL